MDIETFYQSLEKDETELSFETFSSENALSLGKIIISKYETIGKVALEITLNGLCVFSYYPPGTNKNNSRWIARKRNTVDLREMSSLRMKTWLELHGKVQTDCMMSEEEFAVVGGGFPIKLKNGTLIGCISVSNLDHLDDHKIIVESIRDFLEK